jgi:hypothetical protein
MENRRPGTTAWKMTKPSLNREIEVYLSRDSMKHGQTADVFVHLSRPGKVRWEGYRRGDYGGLGGRKVYTSSVAVNAGPQAPCPVDKTTGLIECAWVRNFTIGPLADWVSGLYTLKFIRDDGFEFTVPLVVREPTPRAPLLAQMSVTTWQAYNDWGGNSLYVNDPAKTGFAGARAFKVSFDRPYKGDKPKYEYPMVTWLERKGYDVAYVTNIDIHAEPALLNGRKMFLSIGHDEYWSVEERRAVEQARDGGLSLGFFSANSVYWRIRFEASTRGKPNRTMVCYKTANLDPEQGERTTTHFRSSPSARPENSLLGVMYELWSNVDAHPLIVKNASHWVYEGTGVKEGDTLSHVVGYEWDRVFDNGQSPPSLVRLSSGSGIGVYGQQTPHDMTIYFPTPTSFVFASGTIQWGFGLSDPQYMDARIQRITENVLARAGLIVTPTSVGPQPAPTEPGQARSVTLVAGSGLPGTRDGQGAAAQFDAPTGLAAGPDGSLYVAEARNHRIRKIAPDGTVSTLAGCGPSASAAGSFREGTGTAACFNVPTALAVDSNGTVYVSDTQNSRIRAITRAGVVSTYAGGGFGFADSTVLTSAKLARPRGIAFGPDGALYVMDSTNRAVRRIAASGVTTVATGIANGSGLTVGPDGTLYVTALDRVLKIRRIAAGSPPQYGTVERLAGGRFGDTGGPASSAALRTNDGIFLLGNWLHFSDTTNARVRTIDLTNPNPQVTTQVGDGRFGAGLGTGAQTRLNLPRGLTPWKSGFAIADSWNHRILYVQP